MRRRPLLLPPDAPAAVLTACWLAVPLGVSWLATYSEVASLFLIRYVVVAVLAPIVVTSFCCACRPTRVERSVVALAAIAATLYVSGMAQQYRFDGRILGDRKEDWRGAVELVNSRQEDSDLPVLVRSGLLEADGLTAPHDEQFRQYCLLPVLSIYRVDRSVQDLCPLPTRRLVGLEDRVRELIATRGGAWLLVQGDLRTADAVIQHVLRDLRTAGFSASLVERRMFGGRVTAARIGVARRDAVTMAGS
jgi:hypothetical protein